jgi:hypothetical protein
MGVLSIAGDVSTAAAGLAGLILVFLGAALSGFGAYSETQKQAVRNTYRLRAWPAFGGFVLALISCGLALDAKATAASCPATWGSGSLGDGRSGDAGIRHLRHPGDRMMGLTREMELRLERANLVDYFVANQAAWQAVSQDAYDYTRKQFGDAPVRQDDLAKPLRLVVEIHKGLRDTLDRKKLSQKYWIDFFTSLVIDRTWEALNK